MSKEPSSTGACLLRNGRSGEGASIPSHVLLGCFVVAIWTFISLATFVHAASTSESTFKYMGSCGERITDTEIEGNIAFFVQGPNLRVIDISKPSEPMQVGQMTFEKNVDKIAAHGPALYAVINTEDDCSIHIIDISNPRQPHEKDKFSFKDQDKININLIGPILWVIGGAHHFGLDSAYDISNPLKPAKQELKCREDEVQKDQVKYVLKDYEVHILDVANPKEAKEIGKLEVVGPVKWMIGHGPALYLVTNNDGDNTFHVFDLSDPTHPRESRSFAVGDAERLSMIMTGSILWVWSYEERCPTLEAAYDLSNPLNPVAHATIKPEKVPSERYSAHKVAVQPTLPAWIPKFTYIVDVRTSGSFAYLADRDFGLRIIDTSNPRECRLLGSLRNEGETNCLTRMGNILCLTGSQSKLSLVDVSKPSAPTICGALTLPAPVHALALSGKTLYAAADNAGLLVINLADPQNPQVIAKYDTTGECMNVIVAGQFAYVAADGVTILNITDPSHPVAVKADLDVGKEKYDLLLHGKDLYAFGGDGNTPSVIDISDPSSPKIQQDVFEIEGGQGGGEAIADSLLYAAFYNRAGPYGIYHAGNINLYDLSNSASPAMVRTLDPPCAPSHVFIRGDMLFVSGATGGLMLYQRPRAKEGH